MCFFLISICWKLYDKKLDLFFETCPRELSISRDRFRDLINYKVFGLLSWKLSDIIETSLSSPQIEPQNDTMTKIQSPSFLYQHSNGLKGIFLNLLKICGTLCFPTVATDKWKYLRLLVFPYYPVAAIQQETAGLSHYAIQVDSGLALTRGWPVCEWPTHPSRWYICSCLIQNSGSQF